MKKRVNLLTLRAIEILLSLVLATAVFWGELDKESGLVLSSEISWSLSALATAVFLLLVLEFFKAKPWIRLAYLSICLIAILLSIGEGMAFINAAIWLFSIGYLILTLVAVFRTKTDSGEKSDKSEEKTFSQGIFSERQYKLSLIFTSVFVLSLIAVIALFFILSYHVLILVLFLFLLFILFFFYFLLIVPQETPSPVLKRFYRECNFEELKKSLESFLARPLHSDDRSYIEILLASACSLVDSQEAKNLFLNIKKPKQKNYRLLYDLLSIDLRMKEGSGEEIEKDIRRFQEEYPGNKNGEALRRAYAVLRSTEIIPSVERYYPIRTKNSFLNIVNANLLLQYYCVRQDHESAKIYAEKILNQPNDFTEIKEFSRKILDEDTFDKTDTADSERSDMDGEKAQ